MTSLRLLLTYANMGLLNHADIIGSVTNGQSDGLLWRSLQQTHHLSITAEPLTQALRKAWGCVRQLDSWWEQQWVCERFGEQHASH